MGRIFKLSVKFLFKVQQINNEGMKMFSRKKGNKLRGINPQRFPNEIQLHK